jgi:hypothetical protein
VAKIVGHSLNAASIAKEMNFIPIVEKAGKDFLLYHK